MAVATRRCVGNHAGVEEPTNADLLARAGRGEQAAWDALVDRFGGLVWSVARSFRLDPATAADVSQTTWLRLVEHLDRIREPEKLKSWLATTARNEAFRLIRHSQRYVPTVAFDVMADPAFTDPAAGLLADERSAGLVTALQGLSDDCRQLLRLCTTDPPLGYEEIAAIVGRPVGSIGPTRARCLEQLRRRLAAVDPSGARSQVGES